MTREQLDWEDVAEDFRERLQDTLCRDDTHGTRYVLGDQARPGCVVCFDKYLSALLEHLAARPPRSLRDP